MTELFNKGQSSVIRSSRAIVPPTKKVSKPALTVINTFTPLQLNVFTDAEYSFTFGLEKTNDKALNFFRIISTEPHGLVQKIQHVRFAFSVRDIL